MKWINLSRGKKSLLIVFFLSLLLIAAHLIGQEYLRGYLADQAKVLTGEQVSLGKLSINPFLSSINLEDLEVHAVKKSSFKLKSLFLNFSPIKSFSNGSAYLDQIDLESPTIFLAGVAAFFKKKSVGEKESDEKQNLKFELRNFTLRNGTLLSNNGNSEMEIFIPQLKIPKVSFDKSGSSATLSGLEVQAGKGEANIQGTFSKKSDQLEVKGKWETNAFDPFRFEQVLPAKLNFPVGKVSLFSDGNFSFKEKSGTSSFSASGNLKISDLLGPFLPKGFSSNKLNLDGFQLELSDYFDLKIRDGLFDFNLSEKDSKLVNINGTLKNFSLVVKDFKKPKKQHLSFTSVLNREGEIKISFAPEKEAKQKIQVRIRNLDLVKFSEFLKYKIGHPVTSGKLNLDTTFTIDSKNEIKGKVRVAFSHLSLGAAPKGKKDDGLIPMDKAVELLKDEKGQLIIESELTGKIDNPDLDTFQMVAAILNTVLLDRVFQIIGVEVVKQISPMLLTSIPFSPFAAITIAKTGHRFFSKPRFKGIDFFPHNYQTQAGSQKAVNDVIKFLKQNKSFSLRLCVVTSTHEGGKVIQAKEALKLQVEREEFIRQVFKEGGVNIQSQVVFCKESPQNKNIPYGYLDITI